MALADDFQAVVDSLPPDWTQLELDLRIADEDRYIEAATLLVQINAMPYSEHDWHWRLRVAHEFGHAAARADGARHARAARRPGHRRASWRCARRARAGWRSRRCGAGPSRCARSSAAAGRSSAAWRASRCSARTCCSGRRCAGALEARPATRWSRPGDRGRRAGGRPDRRRRRARWPRPATRRLPTLGFYSHVEQDVRRAAEAAGFTRVVPRSRMAREAAALVEARCSRR